MELIAGIIALLGALGGAVFVGVKQYGKNKSAEKQIEIIKERNKQEREASEETHKKISELKRDDDARDRVRDKYQRD